MQVRHRHRFWRGLTMGGVAVMMALLPTAAFGQTLRHTDPAHDVAKMKNDGSVVAAPTNKTADIVHVAHRHTSLRVITTMRLRDYGGTWEYFEAIKTPTRDYVVFGTGSGTSRNIYLTKAGSETPLPCDGFSATVRPAENTFRVSIPRTCLHGPRWVRMGLAYRAFGKGGATFSDDSLRKGPEGAMTLTLSRRLYTGSSRNRSSI
jgi:hypothetical protein